MNLDFSKLFHSASKDLNGKDGAQIPSDPGKWPDALKVVSYKTYPRFRTIPLPDSTAHADMFNVMRARRSYRDFAGDASISASDLSVLLRHSCGITQSTADHNPRRAQPSGGARYPIEAYLIFFRDTDAIAAGVYHYNAREHGLDVLWERPFSSVDIADLFAYAWVSKAVGAIVLTAVFERSRMKYGERAYRLALIEAGHIGQNVYLSAEALGLGCCGLSGTFDAQVEKLLDVDGVTESVVYALAIGRNGSPSTLIPTNT
ncbi:hypothetical protein A3B35_03160 [Candidatus Kaiserbacteria bacterium RIFCSPLOWO2_01_FULL_54_24]|uniref:Nitroreductase domain-containing protein n=1 Tax=Candidatus Kaiserbacteria bacterium RIFCSPLOWO2_01_FULL_54_24 TaxID=1798515 RepID=A0A1F6EW61_9BACT|nr:MAG: hypothetical protein A3B35_03160 [Candidatus Kaiserbacteria bacterium RIFCSPLOWO2_01_FULL_54_24]